MYNEHNEMVIGSDGLILCRQHSDNLQASRGEILMGGSVYIMYVYSLYEDSPKM